jgi:outer membrane protein TolC
MACCRNFSPLLLVLAAFPVSAQTVQAVPGSISATPAATAINQPPGAVVRQGGIEDKFAIADSAAIARDFETFVNDAVSRRGTVAAPVALPAAPAGNAAWWSSDVVDAGTGGRAFRLNDLIDRASKSSFQLGVFGALPAIRDTGVDEARGRFTAEGFAEVRRSDREDRTTALSQTAGDIRLREIDNSVEAGIRARLRTGTQVTLAQRFSNLDTNNIIYNPTTQSRSRTTLSIVQPLLREAGEDYTTAIERIAGLEADSARLEFRRQAESHLLQLVRSYWTLYLARANYAQEKRAAANVEDLAARLERRSGLDAQPLQLSRARAVAAERSAGLVRAANAVRNAEARLQALINDQDLAGTLVPADLPAPQFLRLDMQTLTATALAQRPEVRTVFLGYRSALLREGMAKSERMPQLDLVLEGSSNGGHNNGHIFPSLQDAWYERPSYTVGARFAVPLGKDERRARYDRRRIETMQQALQARSTIDTVIMELEVSANEFVTANNELVRRGEALKLASADQATITTRWQSGLGGGGGGADGVLYLDQLLNAQDRVTASELDYAEAQATAMVAAANLSRARGTLLSDLGYDIARIDGQGTLLPTYRLVAATPGVAR